MYLLDANAFMEANRHYYAFDIAPGFWAWLADPPARLVPSTPSRTKSPLAQATWSRGHERFPRHSGVADSDDVVAAMARLAVWANAPERQYRQEAVDEFMASADLKLIAHAIVSGATVVTREQPAPDAKKRIKIPDACNAFTVSWTDPFSAYRALGLKLAV